MRVKICGLTEPADVKLARKMGADMIGAILIPESKRYVTVERTKELFEAAGDVAKVAVLMPKNLDELLGTARRLKPDYLQIHPTLPIEDLENAKKMLGVKLIVVVPVPAEGADCDKIVEQARRMAKVADILLVDTKGQGGGGTGLTHDWRISQAIRQAVDKPVFLAGGLNPSNVAESIKAVQPQGVDVASGVEESPGKKGPKLMEEFIRAAKEAGR